MNSYMEQVREAAHYIAGRLDGQKPQFGLILGSGLGDLAAHVQDAVSIAYETIPHFPRSTVAGHTGKLVIGKLEGKDVAVMQGRFHYYEGYSMKQVVFPVYVMKWLRIHSLIITNAAGGMNPKFKPGDLMVITDHLNMTGDNPLIGHNMDELGVRFPDMSEAYSLEYRQLAIRLARDIQDEDGSPLMLQQGVYCGISGPSYMTPAELTMLARLGGDAVGMSTVGEVIAARHGSMKVLGISCITDMAIGEHLEPLTHDQVVAVANRSKQKFQKIVRSFLRETT